LICPFSHTKPGSKTLLLTGPSSVGASGSFLDPICTFGKVGSFPRLDALFLLCYLFHQAVASVFSFSGLGWFSSSFAQKGRTVPLLSSSDSLLDFPQLGSNCHQTWTRRVAVILWRGCEKQCYPDILGIVVPTVASRMSAKIRGLVDEYNGANAASPDLDRWPRPSTRTLRRVASFDTTLPVFLTVFTLIPQVAGDESGSLIHPI